MINSEQDLVHSLAEDLYWNCKVWFEVPNMGQSADVVVDHDGSLVFIEVKLNNWSKALKQCKAHEIVADYIYIAIATKSVSNQFIAEARRNGYGIIHYNWGNERWEYVVESQRNRKLWLPQREILNSKIKIMDYAY